MRFCALILLLACGFWCQPAAAETRVALVVGNTNYEHAPPLANPLNDARAIAAALRRLGFEVQESIDLDMVGMRRALRDFAQRLEDADVGLFFYAGHALQVDGQNYLAPIDANLERSSDLIFEAVELNLVLRLLQDRPRTSIVFLDACRDNPLTRSLLRGLGQARSQAIGQGLADVDSGIGALIAYATQPDNVALDGKGEHSPFTEALLEHIETPGLEVRQMLSRVRRSVIDVTERRQVPWDHSSLTGDFFFQPSKPPEEQRAPVPPLFTARRSADDVIVWSSIQSSTDPGDFALFLQKYPNSPLTAFAQSRLALLRLADQPNTGRLALPLRLGRDAAAAAAAQPTPPPMRIPGPLIPGSTALDPVTEKAGSSPPPPDRIDGEIALAALPGEGLVANPSARVRPIEEPRPEIRSGPAREIVVAALPKSIRYVEPTSKPENIQRARAGEAALDLSRDDWHRVQRALNALEHPAGPEDGLPGPRTREALQAWQRASGDWPTGYLTATQLVGLREDARLELTAVPAARQPSSALPAALDACDRLAGHPADRDRVGPGVAWADLDPMPALRACEAAIKTHPDELRFQLQYGRAHLKAGHLEDARLWFRTAAEKGYVAAQRHVGHMYLLSLGVPADDSKAVGWYRRAAEQDDPSAQYLLGMLHVLGRGVPQDNLQAIGWLRRAAGQGDAGARFVLGWMYSQGRDVQSIAAAGSRP